MSTIQINAANLPAETLAYLAAKGLVAFVPSGAPAKAKKAPAKKAETLNCAVCDRETPKKTWNQLRCPECAQVLAARKAAAWTEGKAERAARRAAEAEAKEVASLTAKAVEIEAENDAMRARIVEIEAEIAEIEADTARVEASTEAIVIRLLTDQGLPAFGAVLEAAMADISSGVLNLDALREIAVEVRVDIEAKTALLVQYGYDEDEARKTATALVANQVV